MLAVGRRRTPFSSYYNSIIHLLSDEKIGEINARYCIICILKRELFLIEEIEKRQL